MFEFTNIKSHKHKQAQLPVCMYIIILFSAGIEAATRSATVKRQLRFVSQSFNCHVLFSTLRDRLLSVVYEIDSDYVT